MGQLWIDVAPTAPRPPVAWGVEAAVAEVNGSHEVPRRSPSAVELEVEGSLLLYSLTVGRVARLNATGALVWRCIDGAAPVGEIAADLSAAFAIDGASTLEDVVTLVSKLRSTGFVEPAEGSGPRADSAEPDQSPPLVLTNPPVP